MGIRVRKLARELQRTPGDLLGLLRELGYERYRTPEDMVSDTIAARLRKQNNGSGGAMGGSPTPRPLVRGVSLSRVPTAQQRAARADGDLMAELVPGVTRAAPSVKRNGSQSPVPDLGKVQQEWAAVKAARAEVEAQRVALAAERAAFEEEQERLRADQEALRLARADLVSERAEMLAAAVAAPPASAEEGGPPSMMEMFDGRGLKGVDEAERALAALAGAKAMGRLLEQVKVREPDALRRLLWERLVLVGGSDIPEELDVPSVIVSQERADIPGAFELSRRCNALGEQLMLNGLVRVALVGIARRWHSLLVARMDPRITLMFRPGPVSADLVAEGSDSRRVSLVPMAGDAPAAEPTAGASAPVDALLIWAESPLDPRFIEVTQGMRTRVVNVPAEDLASWLESVTAALANGVAP